MFSLTPDWEFARRILGTGSGSSPADLRKSPAFDALLRHQRLNGNSKPDPDVLLSGILDRVPDRDGAIRVLEIWENRENDIIDYSREALQYLPAGTHLSGKIFFVAGYDIGIVAPPDVAINLAHPHFISQPDEVGHYITHEVHHLGFLSYRSMPSIPESLRTENCLRELILFMTQMEGIAVHAACCRRKAEGHLENDNDYRVYLDPDESLNISKRFREVWDSIAEKDTPSDEEISTVLNAMSSGERLWYRCGALISEKLENELGLNALVSSIKEPGIFRKYVMDLVHGWRK